jgi:hypothetical protein
MNKLLDSLEEEFGADAASRLRVELSAKMFLSGHSASANELVEKEAPSDHAREVLADLRTIIVGEGALLNPQIARFLPPQGLKELPGVAPLVPTDRLESWKSPKPPLDTETTIATLSKQARKHLLTECLAEVDRQTRKVQAMIGTIPDASANPDKPTKQ